jgi:hypothetical protein
MPNWVSQTVIITGSAEDVAKLKDQVSQPYTQKWVDRDFNQETQKWDIINLKEQIQVPVISFWNIIKPADEILDAYYGVEEGNKDHWYDWNIANWGTKWDACNAEILMESETSVEYHYDTAWSPSLEVIQTLSCQYPNLTVSVNYEEEQGWGGEIAFLNGGVTYKDEYDIPTSHAEIEERGNECWCGGREEKVFADCPE